MALRRYDSAPMTAPGEERLTRRDVSAAVLEILSRSSGPVGSSVIHERLLGWGHRLSEPTVGRLLRDFDRGGYTTRRSNMGRVLTAKGRTALASLRRNAERDETVGRVVQYLRADTKDQLLDVLIARRGVERELARAAAKNASARELAAMRARYEATRRGDTTIGMHDLLASAAHNPVLESLYRMITEDGDLAATVERIAHQHGELVDVRFDRRLLNALTRRDPDGAERAVLDHLDKLLEMVRDSWRAQRRSARRPARPPALLSGRRRKASASISA